jgi:hypothetical protein
VVQLTAKLLNDRYYCTFQQLGVLVAQREISVHNVPVDWHVIERRQASLASLNLGAREKFYSVRA